MSPVPCKKISQNKKVSLEDIFRNRLLSLGIRNILMTQTLKKSWGRFHIKCYRRLVMDCHQEGAVIILSAGVQEKLMALDDPLREAFIANHIFRKTALLIFAQCLTWPASLKKLLQRYQMPSAISSLHENLLQSRMKAILQEKIKKCITVHGVALEIHGQGILITGPSGIGKTTAALKAVQDGCFWIADDRVVIRKNKSGKLYISGHRKIKKYFHTSETGIMAVDQMLNVSQIKNKAELAAVIAVIRTDTEDHASPFNETKMMGTRLPLIKMSISRTGYFNKSLLIKAAKQLRNHYKRSDN